MNISRVALVLGDTIRELSVINPLGGVPSGELYARVASYLDVHQYNAAINTLVTCKLISDKGHFLKWIGPNTEDSSMKKQGKSEKARRKSEDRAPKANPVETTPPSTPEQNAAPVDLVVPTDKGNNLPEGQNIALPASTSALSSSTSNNRSQENRQMATLKYRKTDKSGSSSFAIDGVKSSVYFNKGMFAGEPPQTLEISLPEGFAFAEPGAKPNVGAVAMTPEQRKEAAEKRKAELAAMTPAQRAALKVEAARKTLEAAEKAAAKAAGAPAI